MALGSRGMMMEAARKIRRRGEPWSICRGLSLMQSFLFGPALFRTALPCSGRLSLGEGWDAITLCSWGEM